MKFRTPPRYDVATAIQVSVGERDYYVWLDCEVVALEVAGARGKTIMRAVTSERIKTSALLRASDKHYAPALDAAAALGVGEPCGERRTCALEPRP